MFLGNIAQLGRRWRQGGRPVLAQMPEPALQGAIDELSTDHVAGWIMDPADPARRLPYEVVCKQSGRILASGVADQYRYHLNWQGIGDAAHGFHARLIAPPPGGITVRAAGSQTALPVIAEPRGNFEPLLHIAMDLVDNCNLRCPFCLYDYAGTKTTHFMTDQTLAAALRFLPYVREGQFWFSCLHEPTLHPQLSEFIDTVPRKYRSKLIYTTNLAKRMPDSYFEWLAQSGLSNINISIESRDPAIYERMRKGARHRIFQENWDKLLAAFARAPAPPLLHYIAMAYKSNIAELPGLASYLLEERQAWRVDLRYTFDLPYIAAAFRAAEFLDAEDWVRLREALPPYPGNRLLLVPPPEPPPDRQAAAAHTEPEQPASCLADYYMFRLSWDGTLRVVGTSPHSRHSQAIEHEMLVSNVNDIADARVFLDSLASHAGA